VSKAEQNKKARNLTP